MGKKVKSKAAAASKATKEVKTMQQHEIENGFPVGAEKPWVQLLQGAVERIEQAMEKVEDAKVAVKRAEADVELAIEHRRFVEQKIRRAMEMVRNLDFSVVLAMKPYDDALRKLLEKVGENGAPWSTFAAGASDQDILENLKGGHVYNNEADGYELVEDRLLRHVAGQMGMVKVVEGKALVADVRRLLAIPQPPKQPKPAKSAKKTGKGSGGAVAPPADPSPDPSSWRDVPLGQVAREAGISFHGVSKLGQEDVETLGQLEAFMDGRPKAMEVCCGAKTAATLMGALHKWFSTQDYADLPRFLSPPAADTKPPVPDRSDTKPAKPVQPLGEWLRNARKALKRKGGDPFLVKEEHPWTTWHAEGKRPADAAAAWEKGERGEVKGEGNGEEPPVTPPTDTLPATRIVEIRPSRPLYFTEVYDAFDLGVSEGEIAAAVDAFDFTKPRPGIHVLAAAVRLGEEEDPHAELHVVRDHSDHVGGAGLILLPLLPKHKAPKMTGADPVTGRPVIVNNQTLYIGHPDNGIRVDDKPAAGDDAQDDADAAGELAEPGKVYELEDLDATAPELRAAFAGQAIKRGDPAKVPAPVSIDGYDFLNVGPAAGHDGDTSGDVVRLVQLQREDALDPAAIHDLRENPRGPYCGRRVQSPDGVVYVVGPEDHDLLVWLPAAEAGEEGADEQ